MLEQPDVLEHGFELKDGSIQPVGSALPPISALPAFQPCGCSKSGCNNGLCRCFRTGSTCSQLCSCKNCKNKARQQQEHQHVLDLLGEDSEDEAEISDLDLDLLEESDDEYEIQNSPRLHADDDDDETIEFWLNQKAQKHLTVFLINKNICHEI